jgi:O-antigen/teichoic acid export membrane protein
LAALSLLSRLLRAGEQSRLIVGNAASLVGATAVTSGLGFVYWWFAARNFVPDQVGFAAASVSAMILLGTIAALGLGTLLMGEVSRQGTSPRELIGTALLVSGAAGAILGACFALLAGAASHDLRPLSDSIVSLLLFSLGVAMTAQSVVADQALLGLFRGRLQLLRNVCFAGSKLGFLVAAHQLLDATSGREILVTWIAGCGLSLAYLASVSGAWRSLRSFVGIKPRLMREYWGSALGHHLMNIAINMPPLALPLVAALVISTRHSAFAYTTWLVAGFVFVPPYAIAMALFAAASRDPATLPRLMRLSLKGAMLLNVASIVFIWGAADFLLRFFGAEYGEEASWPLRIAVLGAFPLVVKDNFVVACRIEGTLFRGSTWLFLGSVIEVGGAVAGAAAGGLHGMAAGWLVGLGIESAMFAPTVLRVIRPRTPGSHLAAGAEGPFPRFQVR